MDISRLMRARSVAVVGASERRGSYGGATLLNLAAIGYQGRVWAVNPGRERVHGRECFPTLAELPEAPDAVVIATPAASVPALVAEAGRIGAGGAVVYGAGFAEVAEGAELQQRLVDAAAAHELPVCGPNGNGIVSFHQRLALWGDALSAREAGSVAFIAQSGNIAVNALAARRGLGLHTVVSSGNQAVVDAAEYISFLARSDGVRAIALYLESDGDGTRLCEALADCCEAGVGVAVLKAGSSPAGAAAGAAHTGALAGDQRVFRALVEEAGAAWARSPHELLELAKTLALGRRTRAGGIAVMTCSGGDSSVAADEAARLGLELPPPGRATVARLGELLPAAVTIANPLDYTSLIWGDVERLERLIVTLSEDPAYSRVLVYFDQPAEMDEEAAESWQAVLDGITAGAASAPLQLLVASTLPELLASDSAKNLHTAGVPAIAGLHEGLLCAAALGSPAGDPARLREIGAAAARRSSERELSPSLAEHEAKAVLADAGITVAEGALAESEQEAVELLGTFGPAVAMKLSEPGLRHKSDAGALALGLTDESEVRSAFRRLRALEDGHVLVERMAPAGVELLVSAQRDGVVPALALALGGIWTEALADVVVVPLPASAERVERALRALRGWPLLGGGRGRVALDVTAASRLAAAVGELLLDRDLELVEVNPVIVFADGAVAVDALVVGQAGGPPVDGRLDTRIGAVYPAQ